MQSTVEKIKSSLRMKFYGGMFALFMLMSLDGLVTAERAMSKNLLPGINDPMWTKIFIPELWIFGLLVGLILWFSERRGGLQRDLAGTLLMLVGMGVGSAYQLLGKFAVGH